MSAEALALHFVDNLDSKLNQLRGARDGTNEFQYVRGLGRQVYFPGAGATPLPAQGSAEEAVADVADAADAPAQATLDDLLSEEP